MLRLQGHGSRRGILHIPRYLHFISQPSAGFYQHGAQIFNASHMAPFDVPHITHDMILRFMGVNFSAILDGSARITSSIGKDKKPVHIVQAEAEPTMALPPSKTPEQDKAMWEGSQRVESQCRVHRV